MQHENGSFQNHVYENIKSHPWFAQINSLDKQGGCRDQKRCPLVEQKSV